MHCNVQLVCTMSCEGCAERNWETNLWPSPHPSVRQFDVPIGNPLQGFPLKLTVSHHTEINHVFRICIKSELTFDELCDAGGRRCVVVERDLLQQVTLTAASDTYCSKCHLLQQVSLTAASNTYCSNRHLLQQVTLTAASNTYCSK
jgi:hypothetical protein